METGEFVQILHNGHGHWHVISTIGLKHPTVNIFDSMYSHCLNHSKVQIASILATKEPAIRLQYMDVQMQPGKADCGLFAIALAATIAHVMHPGSYVFEQSLMRSHLLKCLYRKWENDNISSKKNQTCYSKDKKV